MEGPHNEMITVCIITYNHANYIRQAIDGALAQVAEYPINILIADDYSTDGTRGILSEYQLKYPEKIRLILQNKNVGAAKNWIDLISYPKSKYIAYLEGDDYWTDESKLRKQIDFLEKNPDFVICFHPVKILEANGVLTKDYITQVPENYQTLYDITKYGNQIHSPSVVYRNILSSFPEELTKSPIGDFFLYMLLAEHGKIGQIDGEMAVYRHHAGIFSGQSNVRKGLQTLITMSLIRNVFKKSHVDISVLLTERIQNIFNGILPLLTQEDFELLHRNDKNIEDSVIREQLDNYHRLSVDNMKFGSLLHYTMGRILKKIKR
jgi:glycosyltransferase involved in cell wall biosynthesis